MKAGRVVQFGLKLHRMLRSAYVVVAARQSALENRAIYEDYHTQLNVNELICSITVRRARDYVHSSTIRERSIALAAMSALSLPIILKAIDEQEGFCVNDLRFLSRPADNLTFIGATNINCFS